MGDTVRIDWDYLREAKRKLRQLTAEIERGAEYRDLQHSAYKVASFLGEAIPAWKVLDERAPDFLPDSDENR